jgi:hypothetical protein
MTGKETISTNSTAQQLSPEVHDSGERFDRLLGLPPNIFTSHAVAIRRLVIHYEGVASETAGRRHEENYCSDLIAFLKWNKLFPFQLPSDCRFGRNACAIQDRKSSTAVAWCSAALPRGGRLRRVR